MTEAQYRFEPLGSQHDRAAFSCDVPELDRYLQRQARQDMRRNVAAVFVLQDIAEERIAGYYTLSATAIELADLPEEMARRLARYPALPATLMGRLAVDEAYQGLGLGEKLLFNALERALVNSVEIAALAVVVDAKDDTATRFYQHYGFQPLSSDPQRLFIPMRTIAEMLESASERKGNRT